MATFQTEVYVNGSAREHKSVTWEAEIGGDLPGRLSTSTGLSQRKGKITWAEPSQVTPWGHNPFRGSTVPKPGDKVEVWASLDGVRRKVFTGKIDDSSGEAGGETVSTIVDNSDDLSKVVRIDPLLANMPGRRNTSDGLSSPSASVARVVWEALAKCGYRNRDRELLAPSTRSDVVVYAPLQGSTWSDWRSGYGANRKAGVAWNNLKSGPSWTQYTDAGTGGINMTAGYAYYDKDSTDRSNDGFTLMLYVGPNHKGAVDIQLEVSGVSQIMVSIAADRTVTLKVNGSKQATGNRQDFKMGSAGVLIVQMDGSGGFYFGARQPTAGAPTFVSTTGGVSGSYSGVGFNNSWISKVEMWANPGSEVSNLIIVRDSNPSFTQDNPKTAVVNLPMGSIVAGYTPSVRDVQAKSVLEEVSKALCAPMWFDGNGTLHMEYAKYLRSASASGTITPRSLHSIPWKSETLMMASSVRVSAKQLSVTRTKPGTASVTVWQGDGSTLAANEAIEQFVGPNEGEDWIEPDTTFTGYDVTVAKQDKAQTTEISNQAGSVYLTEMAGGAPGDWSFSCTEITPWRWKLNYKSLGTGVSLNIPTATGYGLVDEVKGDKTPIFRAGALVKAVDQNVATVSTAASTAPVLEHDADVWGQGQMATDLANDVAALCGPDRATYFSQVDSFWDPALDVGSVWSVDLSAVYGVRVDAHILSVSHDHTSDKTTVAFRMIRVTNS